MSFSRSQRKKNIINIYFRDNNGGLSHDAKLITTLLKKSGFTVYHNGKPLRFRKVLKPIKSMKSLLGLTSFFGEKKVSISIHLERIVNNGLCLANKNILIPNLEWLREDSYRLFSKMDLFLCKTHSAKDFFDKRDLPAVYTSFSSISPYDEQYEQKPNTFIHIAGNSTEKGTLPLIQLWLKHPEWPKLTVIVREARHLKKQKVKNINYIDKFLERDKLKQLQNEAEIHLCPSEAEGFGHYICEPLSCGAIVVTVNGYPMNELVQPERGFLIQANHNEAFRYSRKFIFDPSNLENIIETILEMSKNEKTELKINAKNWFDHNEAFFQKEFVTAIEECITN